MLKQLRDVDVDDLTEEQAKKFRELSRTEELIKEQRINRQLAGMTYLTGAYSLAQAGIITGGGPTDYAERDRMRKTGFSNPWNARDSKKNENLRMEQYNIQKSKVRQETVDFKDNLVYNAKHDIKSENVNE